MTKATRSTRRELASREAHQAEVISALSLTEHNHVVRRLSRCQYERQHRQLGRYPWRCGSPGCWACRRAVIQKWWRAFGDWLDKDSDISLAIIPLTSEAMSATRRLRKSMRDVRDRAARRDHRWQAVAMAGLIDGDQALVLVQHQGISRADVSEILERRWPHLVLRDWAANLVLSSVMTVAEAAALARRRRGIEPLRIVVMPQITASASTADAMPMAF